MGLGGFGRELGSCVWVGVGVAETGSCPPVVRILFTTLYFHVFGDKICRGFHNMWKGMGEWGVKWVMGGASGRDGGVMGNVMRQGWTGKEGEERTAGHPLNIVT